MTSIREAIQRLIKPKEPLPAGIYHYQSPPDVDEPYRLHLRIERNGQGILIVNASTILHLNQTATEYAYHLINQTPLEDVIDQVHERYLVNRKEITNDFNEFKENIILLIETPDLDPETYIGFGRTKPYPEELSAPYRLDCALTYRLPEGVDSGFAPTKRVARELTSEEWKLIFQKSWQVGIPHLILTGGEPTLRDDLYQLLEYAESLGQVTGLNTDGVKFQDQSYFDDLLQTGLDHLTLLFDPENELLWKIIPHCLEADIFFSIHLTLTLKNVVSAPVIIRKLSDMGLQHLSLSASEPTLFSSLGNLSDLAAELGLDLIWDLPVPYSAFNPVALELRDDATHPKINKAWLYIEPDGDVLPAQGIETKLGNVLEDSWRDIWAKAEESID